jgi:hypothetical protein
MIWGSPSVQQARAEETFHILGAAVFYDDFWQGVQITRAVTVVIPPIGKPVPDVIGGFVHESFFSPEMCSLEVHGRAVRLRIGPEQSFSD